MNKYLFAVSFYKYFDGKRIRIGGMEIEKEGNFMIEAIGELVRRDLILPQDTTGVEFTLIRSGDALR